MDRLTNRYATADCEKTQAPPEQRDTGEASRPMSDSDIIAAMFRYHAPNDTTIPKYAAINQAAKNFAEVVVQNCPSGPDRSAAIRQIREARMTANAAIALNGVGFFF